ncbi:uncharacterized protein LOC111237392 isoform X1 [Seriola dumerili]|uniref:Uncharacterized LOC111237392 n=1 Tax=Seriola dumerili TaxID=41447 RepID=A0A3B4UU90_SERDU|nr:uncharacterized protein LOC111237392 isoform X1 [Seriola dumerili]XP_022622194.1 uncharacterized protein LOC111237392 isoform X1 [Seriola dumerili]
MAFLWRWLNNLMQVRGQVLLFLKPPNPKTQSQILNVFLLPNNVPLEEVKAQQGDSVYIETSSECRLINRQSYSVHCPEANKIVPHIAECNLDYGPNYHPTFEIFLPANIEEVTITLQDPRNADVWKRRVELTGPGPAGIPKRIQDAKMKKIVLINILDDLREDEFKRFKWFLEKESLLSFRESELLEAERVETVDLMVEKYGISGTVKMMVKVLENMSKYDLMKKLLSSGTEGPGPSKTPVSSPPAKDAKMKKTVLINILDDLREDEFKRFKWFLEKESLLSFRESELLEAERVETVDLMVEKYGISGTVKMMVKVLESMSQYDLVKKLLSSGTEGESDVKPDPNTAETKMDVSEDVKKLKKPPSSFTPELKTESTQVSYRFRCPGPGGFQCTLTGLVFVVAQEAELLYRTVQWDESLLQSAGKTPAGPLFNIQCPEEAVCELHLPHCETKDDLRPEGLLSVIHITDDGMSVLEPLEITDTHVIVKVPHLSPFGLTLDLEFLGRFWNGKKPVTGEVLLFLRSLDRGLRVLDVFLLPSNIPLTEVAAQQGAAEYIKISSDCKLITGENYRLHCEPEDLHIQPEHAEFRSKYGPNFFATFEVFLTTNPETVTLKVQDQVKTDVWKRSVPLPGPRMEMRLAAEHRDPAEARDLAEARLLLARTEFINRVSNSLLDQLLNKLLDGGVVTDLEAESMRKHERAETARNVIDVVRKKGSEASLVLITALCELDPFLSRVLGLR